MTLIPLEIFFISIIASHAQTQIPSNTTCPPGYFKRVIGSNGTSFTCTRCDPGTYTMQNGACNVCPQGLQCDGGNNVSVLTNWMALPLLKNRNYLVTSRCAPGWCCPVPPCPYDQKDKLCARNRNASVPFCGACRSGFAETVIWEPSCEKCSRLAVEVFVVAMIMGFILNAIFMCILSANNVHPFYTYYWKIFVYFFQIVPIVAFETNLQLLGPLVWLTSLDWPAILGVRCIDQSLTAVSRMWVAWFISFLLILQVLFVRLMFCREYGCKSSASPSPDDPSNIQMTRQELQESHMGNIPVDNLTRWTSSFWFMITNIFGIILTQSFPLSQCRIVQSYGIRMLYAGAAECFAVTQFLSYIILFVLFLLPGYIFYILYRANTLTRITSYSSLTNTFQDKYYYWEPILMVRRFFIIFFGSSDVTPIIQSYVITTIIGVFLGIQFYFYPFVDTISNRLEVASLLILFVVSLLNAFTSDTLALVIAIFTMLPLLPLPWLIYKYHVDKCENIDNLVDALKEIGVEENGIGKKLCDLLIWCKVVEDDNVCLRILKVIGAGFAGLMAFLVMLFCCCCCRRFPTFDDGSVKPRTGRLHSTSAVGGGIEKGTESGLETVN